MDKLELLKYIISRLDKIITDADNKANFVLGYSIAILGGMAFFSKGVDKDCFHLILLTLMYLSFIGSSLLSFITLFPRNKKYGYKLKQSLDKSIFFYLDLNEKEVDMKYFNNLTDGQITADSLNQAKQLSYILEKKMNLIKISIPFVLTGTAFAFIIYAMEVVFK